MASEYARGEMTLRVWRRKDELRVCHRRDDLKVCRRRDDLRNTGELTSGYA